MHARSFVAAACLLAGGVAVAQPAQDSKVDAKSLLQSGLRLLEARDYLGALAVFKDAYARFPSAKILLNIGTTQNLLERKADAANTYQRYLDAPDADPAKKPDVSSALAEIDRVVGVLEISVTPDDAEVQINDGEWVPAKVVKLFRVPQGQYTVRARKDRYGSEAKSAYIIIGEKATVAIALTALPAEADPIAGNAGGSTAGDASVFEEGEPEPTTRSRIAGIVLAHVDIPRQGGAARVGLGVDLVGGLQLQGAALLGPNSGVYAGANVSFLSGLWRPYVTAGMPIFFSDGARYGLRGGGGLELVLTRHVSLMAEVGVEVLLNPEDDIRKAVVIPAVGATGRL